MRYYNLYITDPKTGQSIVPNSSGGFTRGTGPTFSSLAKLPMTGQMVADPGALNIEFDIPISQLAKPQGASRLKIWGVGLGALSQASQLAGMNVQLSAGMSTGLPLANPAQAGMILRGVVFTGYGNWEGTNQTLDLIVNPGPPGTTDSIFDRSLSFFWPAGTPLADAINVALEAALPEFKRKVSISPNLTLPNPEAGWYANLSQWASYLLGLTQPLGAQLLGFNYPGVQIVATGDTIYVFDGTQNGAALTQLQFQDLIGQPTWISGTEIQFNKVLRANIGVGNTVKFPSGILAPYALTSPAAAVPGNSVPVNSKIAFQGTFTVTEAHHMGNFRDPNGLSWVTAFKAAYNAGSGPVPSLS